MGPEDRQFPEFFTSQYGRLRRLGFLWVIAPLPPEARPLSFTSFDAAGQQIARGTTFAGYANCR